MHVVLCNGAPFSGKDTLVKDLLSRYPDACWVRFKDVLYTDSYKRLFPTNEISFDEWVTICNDVKLKDQPLPYFLTKLNIATWIFDILIGNKDFKNKDIHKERSPRLELIYQSEEIIKPNFGEGGVAVRTAQNMIDSNPDHADKLFLFSDGGFNYEVNTLIATLGIKRSELTVIRILADGCTFEGDSREYIENPDFTVFNPKTAEFFTNVADAGIYKKLDELK